MSYLRLDRARILIACFLVTSLLFIEYPGIDVHIASLFYAAGFQLKETWWHKVLHEGMGYFIASSLIGILGVYLFNRAAKKNIWNVDGKKISYVFLVLIVGAGLIVNVLFKEQFGRARPRDVEEFGGSHRFTPAFIVSQECHSNCSFSSGESAGGFFAMALALALSRKRAALLAAVAFGGLISLSRIAVGAHFFSDTVVSFFVMLITADVLYYYIVLPSSARAQPAPTGQLGGVLEA